MSSTIQIKFLTLDEMANAKDIDWRYEHVGIDNLGFADKAKNRVFVRAGLEPQLQTLLIDHELSHLFEMEGTDEDEHGIRHKKKGGFMKIFMPILGAIIGSVLMPGIGTMLGMGGLGGAAGLGLATGAGSMLGGVAGSSATGKPNWLGNAIGGAGAGVGAGLGSALGGAGGTAGGMTATGSEGAGRFMDITGPTSLIGQEAASKAGSGIGQNIGQLTGSGVAGLFQGAVGQGQSGQGSSYPTSGGSSFRMPDMSQQANTNPGFSGWGDYGSLPETPDYYGATGVESPTNSRGMGGQAMMPTQVGLGQGGINLAGKDYAGGFQNKQMAGGMDQMFNPSDPYGAASNMSF